MERLLEETATPGRGARSHEPPPLRGKAKIAFLNKKMAAGVLGTPSRRLAVYALGARAPSFSARSLFFFVLASALFGLHINFLGQLRELFVSFFLFLEGLVQQSARFALAQQVRPSPHAAVSRDLVMLDALRGGDQRSIHNFALEILLHDFLALLDKAHHAGAFFAGRFLAEVVKDFLQAIHVAAGLLQVFLETRTKLL